MTRALKTMDNKEFGEHFKELAKRERKKLICLIGDDNGFMLMHVNMSLIEQVGAAHTLLKGVEQVVSTAKEPEPGLELFPTKKD